MDPFEIVASAFTALIGVALALHLWDEARSEDPFGDNENDPD